MGRRFQAFVLFATLITLSAVLVAQVRVDVQLVNVVATVTDGRGQYVPQRADGSGSATRGGR